MLKRLIESRPESISNSVVISLTSVDVVGDYLRMRGVKVHALGITSPFDFLSALWRIVALLKHYRPDVVQTWMYHADLIGGIAALLAGSCSIVWGVRSSSIPQGKLSFTYWLIRLCAIFSYFIPDRIICCATSAKEAHVKLHYAKNKIIVVPNGYKFSDLEFNLNLRKSIRAQLAICDDDIIIGVVGRFDPLKDFYNFVSAAAILAQTSKKYKFLMIGRENEWSNVKLHAWISSVGLLDRFYLVGQQTNIAHYLSAMDIFCLSSLDEAFPNVVVEAMAIGLPCVVTQAGDAAIILGDDDYVVPVKDAVALATALLRICSLDLVNRMLIGKKNAENVRNQFDIKTIAQKYTEIYSSIKKERF